MDVKPNLGYFICEIIYKFCHLYSFNHLAKTYFPSYNRYWRNPITLTYPIMSSSHSHPANTQPVERPALEALNLLNSKLENDHKYLHLENRITELELER